MTQVKISALASQTSLATSDILPVVVNPGTTPATKRATIADTVMAGTLYSVVPAATSALTAGTGAQNAFPSDQDVFTLEANTTYRVEGLYIISKSGTACTVALSFVLTTLTVNVMRLLAWATNAAANATATASNFTWINQVAATVVTASASTATAIRFEGLLRTGTAGTITPQITFSAAPTSPVMDAGSYIRFEKWDSDTQASRGSVA